MKKTIHKEIFINAPREKVWDTMLGDATYREWTKSFNPTSHFEGSWDQGSKMLFLGSDVEGGLEGGMVSHIKENRLHEFLSIEHMGIVSNGVEDTESDQVKPWKGSLENYTFTDKDGGTLLTVEMDIVESEAENMDKMWDKALVDLKEIAER